MTQKFHIYVKGGYIGTVYATEAEIKRHMPWSEITGSSVNLFAAPPKAR